MRSARRPGVSPSLETLEGRQLLATSGGPTPAARLPLDTDFAAVRYDLDRAQLTSHVTDAELRHLAADLKSCYAVHGREPLPDAQQDRDAIFAFNYDIALAFIDASFTARDWARREAAIGSSLHTMGFSASTAELDRVTADLQAIARSAGVSREVHHQLVADLATAAADWKADQPTDPARSGPAPAWLRAKNPITEFEGRIMGFVPGRSAGHGIFLAR